MNKGLFKNLKSDLPSGLVVFLVALPFCLGISLASGAPFFSGIISGVVGGIVIASLSNSVLRFGAGIWKNQKIDSGYIKGKLFYNHGK
jgi:MFS superfamily sulfate permease-like transporter